MAEELVNLQNLAPNLSGPGELMSKTEVLLTLITNVGLRSWDVYSDVAFAIKLIVPKCYMPDVDSTTNSKYFSTFWDFAIFDDFLKFRSSTFGSLHFKNHQIW